MWISIARSHSHVNYICDSALYGYISIQEYCVWGRRLDEVVVTPPIKVTILTQQGWGT